MLVYLIVACTAVVAFVTILAAIADHAPDSLTERIGQRYGNQNRKG